MSPTTSAAAPIRPAPRTPVAPISRTRASAVIPGRSLRCLTFGGPLFEIDVSALSADDHVPSHNAPVLDLYTSSHQLLQVFIVRHRCLECLIILHVHHLEKISGNRENLSRPFVYERDLCLPINGADEVLLLSGKSAYSDNPCLRGAVLARLRLLELHNFAGLAVNKDVLAYFQTANFDRLAHETAS